MNGRFEKILAELALCTGSRISNTADEHERWPLYLSACEKSECFTLLFDLVALEPDPNVALGIVLQVLGNVSPASRPAWIAQLQSARNRDYATRRAKEVGIYQTRSITPLLTDEDVEQSWSDWLQIRLAEFSEEAAVLQRLSEKGRTTRIRRTASRRLAATEAPTAQA
jgi:hypothetical protein